MSTTGEGVAEVWEAVERHREHAAASGELERRRRFRLGEELREIVARRLEQRAREVCTEERWAAITDEVVAGDLDPWTAADELLNPVLSFDNGRIAHVPHDGSGSGSATDTPPR